MKVRLKEFWQNFWSVLKRPEMAILPGQLAFFFVLSIVPTITIISYGASFLDLPHYFIYNFIEKAFNSEIAEMIVMGVSGVTLDLSFYVALIFGFYFASNGAASIIVTSNTIYGIKNSSFLKRRLKAAIMTIFIVFLFLFILIVPIFGNKIVEIIRHINLNNAITNNIILTFNIMKGPITWLIMFIFIKIIYTLAPDRKMPSRINKILKLYVKGLIEIIGTNLKQVILYGSYPDSLLLTQVAQDLSQLRQFVPSL